MENQYLRRSGGTFALVLAQIQSNSESAGNGPRKFAESKYIRYYLDANSHCKAVKNKNLGPYPEE
jgi:hypothetical protein